MNIRKTTSLTALLSFILLILTSIILYIVPHGRVAYWSDWHLWGLSKTEWGNIHINLGLLFLLSILLHIYYNWKPILSYLKNKARQFRLFTRELIAALALTLFFAVGTYFLIPPFIWVMDLNDYFKQSAIQKYGEPPYGHAELSTLKSFASRTGLNVKESVSRLKKEKLQFEGQDQTLLEIAEANRMSPQQVYNIIRPKNEEGAGRGLPENPPSGLGRLSLTEICSKYQVDVNLILTGLSEKGISADADMTVKEIAGAQGKNSRDVYDMIRAVSRR